MSLESGIPGRLRAFGLGDEDLSAWQRSGRPEDAFEDWLTDRVARCPAGRRARATYGADDVHGFARRPVLAALDLRPGDRLLEIGCGGGLLLRDGLATGASATGIDHSREMVALARERAPGADVHLGYAGRLPFGDGAFTAIAMVQVFMFLAQPAAVLAECRRVAGADARLAIYTVSAQLRGTPAAPEPLAGHCHFYSDDELIALARDAGFGAVAVADQGGAQLLTATASTHASGSEGMGPHPTPPSGPTFV